MGRYGVFTMAPIHAMKTATAAADINKIANQPNRSEARHRGRSLS